MTSFAIVPAAGLSRRMGQPKLLLSWNDSQTIIDATLDAWQKSRVSRIMVVVRADDVALQTQCQKHNVQVVLPQVDPPHMKDSVLAALAWIDMNYEPTPSDVWLLAPADMPRLSSPVVNQLLDEHNPNAPAILKPAFQGKHGHPVLFPWPLAAEAQLLPDNVGLDVLTRRHEVRTVDCDEACVLDDLNTPAEYDLLRKRRT